MNKTILFVLLLTQKCTSLWTDEILIIEAGMCMGNCPVYTLKLQSDGRFEMMLPKSKGSLFGRLNHNKLTELQGILNRIDFNKSEEQYGNPLIRDLPKITIVFGNTKIQFNGRQFAPKFYRELIEWSDELVKRRPT